MEKLYKYRHIGEPNSITRNRLKEIIVDQKLYFSKPSQLNDPFDCKPACFDNRSAKERRHDLIGLHALKRGMSRNEVLRKFGSQITQQLIHQSSPTVLNDLIYNTVDAKTAILSLSGTATSNLEWAHYGDSHKGICLEFTITNTQGSNLFSSLQSVIYTDKRPTIDFSKMKTEEYIINNLIPAIHTKSTDWKYEKEKRVLSMNSGAFKFPTHSLTKVIFGANTPSEYKDYVRTLLVDSKTQPSLHTCQLATDEFHLEIIDE